MSPRGTTWLVAEDNGDEFWLLQRALRIVAPNVTVQRVTDGLQAKQYLLGEKPFDDRSAFPLPRLMLLDLKMPRCTGLELMAWLKTQPALQHIPSFIFSSSSAPADMAAAHELGARAYLIKPDLPHELEIMVKELVS
jgi:CheY-like chemotaxis protein